MDLLMKAFYLSVNPAILEASPNRTSPGLWGFHGWEPQAILFLTLSSDRLVHPGERLI